VKNLFLLGSRISHFYLPATHTTVLFRYAICPELRATDSFQRF